MYTNKESQPKLEKMDYPLLRSRWCNLNKQQMQYVNTIAFIVQDVKDLNKTRSMSKVLDHLYLGNFEDANDVKTLKAEGITHIINTVDNYYENCRTKKEFYGDEFRYFGFTSDDDERYPITQHFEECYQFIEDAKSKSGKCFIHCIAGINRSGCLATAYVMLHENIGPISAAKKVFEARGMILSNNGFIERLVKLAADKGLLERDEKELLSRFKTT